MMTYLGWPRFDRNPTCPWFTIPEPNANKNSGYTGWPKFNLNPNVPNPYPKIRVGYRFEHRVGLILSGLLELHDVHESAGTSGVISDEKLNDWIWLILTMRLDSLELNANIGGWSYLLCNLKVMSLATGSFRNPNEYISDNVWFAVGIEIYLWGKTWRDS